MAYKEMVSQVSRNTVLTERPVASLEAVRKGTGIKVTLDEKDKAVIFSVLLLAHTRALADFEGWGGIPGPRAVLVQRAGRRT